MKLEVGMYIRFNNGSIQKINHVDERDNPLFDLNIDGTLHSTSDIKKASHNIIDLIEVGDYVNGFPVIHKENDILKCGLLVQFKENEIKLIVTKEQFEQMQYKVGE